MRYHASYMILHIHSDASYLSEKEAISRSGGLFYIGSSTNTYKKLTNGAILIISTVLKHVMSSAAEAEIGAVFINDKEGAVFRATLEELGHLHILIPPHQWRRKIPLPQATAMAQEKKNATKQLICVFIG
jgi:hypothetical protein